MRYWGRGVLGKRGKRGKRGGLFERGVEMDGWMLRIIDEVW